MRAWTDPGHVLGCLLVILLVASIPPADGAGPAESTFHPVSPEETLALANQALATGTLSAGERARTLLRRGLADEMLGQRDDALEDFTLALSSGALTREEQSRALYDRGVTLDELNRPDDAIGDYTAALKLNPRLAAALNNRANAFRRSGRLAEARRDYEASIAAGNEHPEYPHFGLGQIAETLGQIAVARENYRSALMANPQFGLAYERLKALDAGPMLPAPEPPVVLTSPAAGDTAAVHLVAPRESSTMVHLVQPKRQGRNIGLKPAINDYNAHDGSAIQLGAWRCEAQANSAWNRMRQAVAALLGGLSPQIFPVDLRGRGRYFRLRVLLSDAGTARGLCRSLKAQGLACLVVSS